MRVLNGQEIKLDTVLAKKCRVINTQQKGEKKYLDGGQIGLLFGGACTRWRNFSCFSSKCIGATDNLLYEGVFIDS